MKEAEKVINPKERLGDNELGILYDGGKVRGRREWRGFKDTVYDFSRWLYIWGILIKTSMSKGFVKGLFRYRWLANYLAVPHMIDKFTLGLRDEPLRITQTAMNYVAKDVATVIRQCLRADVRCGNDKEFSDKCVLTDENAMTAFMMGFLIWLL